MFIRRSKPAFCVGAVGGWFFVYLFMCSVNSFSNCPEERIFKISSSVTLVILSVCFAFMLERKMAILVSPFSVSFILKFHIPVTIAGLIGKLLLGLIFFSTIVYAFSFSSFPLCDS